MTPDRSKWDDGRLDERFRGIDRDLDRGTNRMDRERQDVRRELDSFDGRLEDIENDHEAVLDIPHVVANKLDAFRDEVRGMLRDYASGRRDSAEWTRWRVAQVVALIAVAATLLGIALAHHAFG